MELVKRISIVSIRAAQSVSVADFIRFISDHSVEVEITKRIVAARTSENSHQALSFVDPETKRLQNVLEPPIGVIFPALLTSTEALGRQAQ